MSAREGWHGTEGGYTNHDCRCVECSSAHRLACIHHKNARLAARQVVDGRLVHPDAPHGNYSSYTNYGCRCDECRAANRHRSQRIAAYREAVASCEG